MDTIGREEFENQPLDLSGLPRFEEVTYVPLEPKYLLKRNLSTSISVIIFSGILVVGYFAVPPEYAIYFPWLFAFFFLMFIWRYIINYQLYKRSGYALRERDIIFKRGFLYEKITVVPFNRVQHVSTNRSVLDKALGLSTLNVFTAGGAGSDVAIPGLSPETAGSLKEALAERMSGHV